LYTFYPFTLTLPGYDLSIPIPLLYAEGLQSYFISFVKHGNPNIERRNGTVAWPIFGSEKTIVDTTIFGFDVTTDDELPEDRCGFWEPALYV